ncbi:hypothetical protein CRG98_003794 [Punica granatum]|uniref:Uncharacterized protein n=1 Tax=Punica granatum TaxID=22663 RepID=A0A2I0L581_PUNGR|nr:hypothetical protein CRG98_003794 [Punica granatum]
MRGKNRGRVRVSGDSVERLEECLGARNARSGKDENAGHVRSARRTGGAQGARQARGCECGRAGVRGWRLCSGAIHPRAWSSPKMKKST